MSKIFLVAGTITNSLAEYLNTREAVEVSIAYESLYANAKLINSSMIRVDKLVYLYQNDEISIRKDMEVLLTILQYNLNKIEEIIFLVKDSPNIETITNYFRTVTADSSYNNYVIKKFKGTISFPTIYDSVLGISESSGTTNKYTNIYRAERGEQSKEAYETSDDKDIKFEPFNYKSIMSMDNGKQIAIKTESGIPILDNPEQDLRKYPTISLETITVDSSSISANVLLFSGNPKSGSTTYSLAFAVSSAYANKKVLLINMCYYDSLSVSLDINSIKYSNIDCKKIISSEVINSETDITVLTLDRHNNHKIRFDILLYLIRNKSKLDFDYIFLDVPLCDIYKTTEICSSYIHSIALSSQDIELELVATLDTIHGFLSDYNIFILLNNNINYQENFQHISAVKAKDFIGRNVTVVKPIELSDFDIDDTIYRKLLEE